MKEKIKYKCPECGKILIVSYNGLWTTIDNETKRVVHCGEHIIYISYKNLEEK